MLKKKVFSLFMAIIMVATYCIGALPFNVVAISSPSEVASLESISPGQTKTVEIAKEGGYVALKFTPTTSGKYYFYSLGDMDPMVCLYDSNLSYLNDDDDGLGIGTNFKIEYDMKAGSTYVYEMKFWDDSTGSFDVVLEKASDAESLAIDQGEAITGYINDTADLTVTFLPEGCTEETVNWVSADNTVATVDCGFVSFIKPGTTVITATSESGLSDSCTVVVKDYSTITTGTKTSMEITASRDYDCLYFTPSTTGMYAFYSMSSSDPFGRIMSADYVDLATDDNSGSGDNFRVECQLTAGTTYILKSEFNGIETGKFDVIVTKIVAAQGISITQGATISGAVGYSQQLSVTFSPDNYIEESITWTSSDSSKVSVTEDGLISLLAIGSATITATSQNGLVAKCVVNVSGYLTITEGEEKQLSTDVNNGKALFKFVPSYSGAYVFYSYDGNSFDTRGYIYDANMKVLAFNDDANEEVRDFYVTYRMTAGETYYLETVPLEEGVYGEYKVQIRSLEAASSMTIEQGNLSGYADDFYYLTVKFFPENAVTEEITWKSNNEDVAVIYADGRLELVSVGTAVITATSEGGLTATCTVTVKARAKATAVEIGNGSTLKGIVGGTDSFYCYFMPSECEQESVTWTSSNKNVATIDEYGTITFLKAGTTIITVTSQNGLTDTCTVTVENKPNPTSIMIAHSDSLTGYPGEKISLWVEYLPVNCIEETITWSSNNTAVATVGSDGKVTLVGTGTAVITAKSQSGLTDTCEVIVKAVTPIACNVEKVLSTDTNGGDGFFSFIPSATGTYAFYSYNCDFDVRGYVYDNEMTLLKYDDDGADGSNFRVQYEMTAGKTYYLKSEVYSSIAKEEYSVKVIKLAAATSLSFVGGNQYVSYVGGMKAFEVSFAPFASVYETITWKSGNTSIATISSSGVAEFKKTGTVVITATSASGLTASCTVVVKQYPTLKVNENFTINIAAESDGTYFYFTPETTGEYVFWSSSTFDTYGYIMDSNMSILAENDDGDEGGYNFKIVEKLTAGVTYILKAKFLDESDAGSVMVCVNNMLSATKLEVVSLPNRVDYIKGFAKDYIDFTGLELKITWSDGSTTNWIYNEADLSIEDSYVIFDTSSVESTGKINVLYDDVSATFEVTVAANTVSKIEIVKGTSQTYIEACDGYMSEYYNPDTDSYVKFFKYAGFSHNDAVVKITYTNGTIKNVNVGSVVNGYTVEWSADQATTPWVVGTNNASVISYLGKTVKLPITVIANPLESIELVKAPTREYVLGDLAYGTFGASNGYLFNPDDLTGLELKFNYTNGTSETVTADDFNGSHMYKGYVYNLIYSEESVAVGKFPVTFKYLGRTVTYNVNVIDSNISAISVAKKPDESHNVPYKPLMFGLELNLIHNDTTSETIVLTDKNIKYVYDDGLAYEVMINGYAARIVPSEYYEETYIVYYLGRTCTFDLSFNMEKEVSNITLENVTPNADGMKVNVSYADGEKETLVLMTSTDWYTFDESGMVVGFAQTDRGMLYFEVMQETSGNNVVYTISILGKTVTVTEAKPSDMPEDFIDVGNDFVAQITFNSGDKALDFKGLLSMACENDREDNGQQYYFVRQTDGSYKIINVKTRYVLALKGVAQEGAGVKLVPTQLSSQCWFIHYVNGKYVLRAAGTDNLVLGAANEVQLVTFDADDLSATFNITKMRIADYDIPDVTEDGELTDAQIAIIKNLLYSVSADYNSMNVNILNQKITEYAVEAFKLGVTDIKAIAMCVNIRFASSAAEVSRVLNKSCEYSLDGIYTAMLTDIGTQVGAQRTRHFEFYKGCANAQF